MAYVLKLGTFAKKKNSTAQPDMTGWAEFAVTLKGGSDLLNPILDLAVDMTDIINYNYAYIFGSYYFVRSKVMIRSGLCTIALEEDVLANYKEAIGQSSLYIVRSSATFDGSIVDRYYPQKASKTTVGVPFENAPNVGFGGGYFVINAAGKKIGSSTLYSLTSSAFATFIGQLMGTIDSAQAGLTADWAGLIESFTNSIFEPMRYINCVMWFPGEFPGTDYIGTSDPMYIGKWQCGVDYRIINNPILQLHDEVITLPKHPAAAYRGKYLNLAPYSQYTIEYDPFGTFTLDSSQLVDETEIRATVYVDALTGQGVLKIRGENGTASLASITTQLGVQLPITASGIGSGTVSSAVSVVGGIGSLFAGNLAGAAGVVGAGIDSAMAAITGSVSSIGSQGGVLSYATPKGLVGTFFDIIDEDNLDNGRPLCIMTTPESLGGYMVAEKAPLSISCTAPELEEIETYLTSGFYYE